MVRVERSVLQPPPPFLKLKGCTLGNRLTATCELRPSNAPEAATLVHVSDLSRIE